MKKKQPKFYQCGDKFLATTGDSIKNLPTVFVSFSGDNPGSVKEECISKQDLDKMVLVEGADVPGDWLSAFEVHGIKTPRQDEEDLFHGHLAGGCDMFTAAAASYTQTKVPVEPIKIGTNDLIVFVIVSWILSFFVIGLLSS